MHVPKRINAGDVRQLGGFKCKLEGFVVNPQRRAQSLPTNGSAWSRQMTI